MIKRKSDDQTILRMRAEGKSFAFIANYFSCSKQAIRKQYRRLQEKAEKHDTQNAKKTEGNPRVETRYVRKRGSTEIYAYSPFLVARGDMVSYSGPVPIPRDFTIPESEIEWLTIVKGKRFP